MRERVHFDDHLTPEIINKITDIDGISECVILTTCNRVEIYMVCLDPDQSARTIIGFLENFHGISAQELDEMLYIYRCHEAARHLLRVASGLESMIIGEGQILGQVRAAYHKSKKVGGSGPYLNKLFQTAFALGKQVRRNTVVNSGVTSIASAAAKLAMERCDPKETRYGILGCGEMGTIVARHMSRRGVKNILLSNRSSQRAETLAKEIDCKTCSFDNLEQMIHNVDCLISATASTTYILTWRKHSQTLAAKTSFPIIDIAIPRDVDSELGTLPNVKLYSIDDLKDIIDRNINLRKSSITTIEECIEKKLGLYERWYKDRYENRTINQNRDTWVQAGPDSDRHRRGSTEERWHHERSDY